MNTRHYAILEGKKVVCTNDIRKWSIFMHDVENRIVKKTMIQPKIEVSTVFLGTNHGYGDNDLWFETMVFGFFNNDIDSRYETWEEAEKGHNAAVETVRERLKRKAQND